MFTGIIEDLAEVVSVKKDGTNLHIKLCSSFTSELKIDQSVSHNGVCLTVVDIESNIYTVTAIKETLQKSNLGYLVKGSKVNIERSMKMGDRVDGHIVQGHVDQIAECVDITEETGSYVLCFRYEKSENITVEKGSICVNGISLTVVSSEINSFKVAIIPYTWDHTNLYLIKKGDIVNLEFDILGKYIAKLINIKNKI
jgi:riboflavin synthase